MTAAPDQDLTVRADGDALHLGGALTVWTSWGAGLRWWVLTATVLTALGVVITMVVNVPANDRLDAAGAPEAGQAFMILGAEFEQVHDIRLAPFPRRVSLRARIVLSFRLQGRPT